MEKISKNAVIYPNVKLGGNCQIEDFCIIGKPARKNDKKKTIIGNNAVIRSGTVIYNGNVIGNNFKTGDGALLRENNKIGNNVVLGSRSIIEGFSKIEDNAVIHTNCYIGEDTTIKKNAWIGPGSITLLTMHPRCIHKEICNKGPIIGPGAIIGAGAILLPWIKIGKGAMVGAGALVRDDVPDKVVVAGSPAKPIKKVSEIKCPFNKKYEQIQN